MTKESRSKVNQRGHVLRAFMVRSLPPRPLELLRQLRLRFRLTALRVFTSSQLLSRVYYLLFTNAFGREAHAVLSGRKRHLQALLSSSDNKFQLRRNVHRLEKGLIMQPRRSVFGVDYIGETLDCFEAAICLAGETWQADPELRWSHDVLTSYFKAVSPHPRIDSARERLEELSSVDVAPELYPKPRGTFPGEIPSFEDFLRLCQRRRSVRWFSDKPVPRELLDRAIAASVLSPSACNRQPYVLRIFDEPGLLREVSSLPMGTSGFAHQFPAIIVIVGQLHAYQEERDRHVIYVDAALAAMSLMLACETLGLSTCPINWPDIEERELRMATMLSLEPEERVVMLLAVGFATPEGLVPYSQKRALKDVRRYNEL